MPKQTRAAKTAVLFILKNPFQAREGFTSYTMVVSFMDINYLPPYLPAMHFMFPDRELDRIRGAMEDCRAIFADCIDGVVPYDAATKAEISELIAKISSVLYKCSAGFDQVLKLIAKMGVSNLVIFTDDKDLPWVWSYADDGFEDVLCERYSCGVVFAETSDQIGRISDYIADARFAQTTVNDKIAMLIGAPCEGGEGGELDRVAEILSAERDARGMPRKLSIRDFRHVGAGADNSDFRQHWMDASEMKIIHFAGHIEGDQLVTGSYRITAQQIDQMDKFRSHPVVFLNGCSSGQITDLFDAGAQMCTMFLKKLAQACVVNLMPIEDEIGVFLSTEFYSRIMGAHDNTIQSLGQALQEIRIEMRTKFPNDPQRLFFQLYGDPRSVIAMLGASDFLTPLIESKNP